MRIFDVYIAVDWSSRNGPSPAKPSKDAIWVGEGVAPDVGDERPISETYWRTRAACVAYLRERLQYHARHRRRVCIGFDFAYGYPTGFADALDLQRSVPPWRHVWNELTRLVVDDDENNNNRFIVAAELNKRCGGDRPGPFWGCPVGRAGPTLQPTSPNYPYQVRPGHAIDRLRWVEQRERGVQPTWRLYGTGSVGGQSIVGIPALCWLRDDEALSPISRVWPFETGFTPTPTPTEGPFILHVEIWPGVVPFLDPSLPIRDQAQVRAMVRWLIETDSAGQLNEFFAVPDNLPHDAINNCTEEEGWIIGGGMKAIIASSQREPYSVPLPHVV